MSDFNENEVFSMKAKRILALLAALLLPLGPALGLGFLGLAHGLFSPLVQSMRAPVGRGKNRPGDLPAAMFEPLY